MVTIRSTILSLTALSTALAQGSGPNQRLQVVWSAGAFSTISGPSGNEIGHDSGFAITDSSGVELYSEAYPGDHAPCYNTGDGRTFTLSSTCWSRDRRFKCKSDFGGFPEMCEIQDSQGNSQGEGEGSTDTTFIGIALSQDGGCGVGLILENDEHCDDQAEWTVSD